MTAVVPQRDMAVWDEKATSTSSTGRKTSSSAWRNISSIEVEKATSRILPYSSARWCRRRMTSGRIPVAIVVLKEGEKLDPVDLLCFLEQRLASSTCRGGLNFSSSPYQDGQRKIVKRALRERMEGQRYARARLAVSGR